MFIYVVFEIVLNQFAMSPPFLHVSNFDVSGFLKAKN